MKTARVIGLCLAVTLWAGACTVRQQSVVPRPIVSHEASFDGNAQNSGIVNVDEHGFIVTSHWLDRYDAMLAVFGTHFSPAIKPGDRIGVEALPTLQPSIPKTFRVTSEVMVRFTRMNQWRKAEQGP